MRNVTTLWFLLALLLASACSPNSLLVGDTDEGGRPAGDADGGVPGEPDLVAETLVEEELSPGDLAADVDGTAGHCKPGDGCFLDKCQDNTDCEAGWCVAHMGESVCSQSCQEECPPGWSCKQVSGAGPDVLFICVSNLPTLCRPCSANADCAGPGGTQDSCLWYGDEAGSYCGGQCVDSTDCPWGFACKEAQTTAGVKLKQCVAEAGICPCTADSARLGLSTPCLLTNEDGSCNGKRVCLVDGLSACDALVPGPEECNGIDDNCNGAIDEPLLVEGLYVGLCDDGNDCTSDSCQGSDGCVNTALDSGQCNDGNPCTVADHCEAGQCLGSPVICDDKNPCTENLCTLEGGCLFLPIPGKCDDGDPCTVGDYCEQGECQGTAVPCDCLTNKDCALLEDGDLCNGKLVCDQQWPPYKCTVAPETIVKCPELSGPDALCLVASCDPQTGKCGEAPANEGGPCNDGNPCTGPDLCVAGACQGQTSVNCNDGNPCTDDSCSPALGCLNLPNQLACNDGNVCTTNDKCSQGLCLGGPALACDDGDTCNGLESCNSLVGCTAGQPLPCDDGLACNGVESCSPTQGCLPGKALPCDDGNPCTTDQCDEKSGCQQLPLTGGKCNDNNVCTVNDQCLSGSCVGSPANCEDGNPCTDNTCNPATGCLSLLNTALCDDGNVCTVGDRCQLGQCTPTGSLNCNDNNPCTNDSCHLEAGCQFLPNQAQCTDNNQCTTGDHCAAGMCTFTGFLACDDSNPCTDNSCLAQTGCHFPPNQKACDDGDPCTNGDLCQGGQCKPGPALDCDDNDPCTDDSCVGLNGCLNLPNTDLLTDELNCGFCGHKCPDFTICQGGQCLLLDGQPCALPADCLSGYCRTDWDGAGLFCAQDAVSCVYALSGKSATQVSPGAKMCGATTGHRSCSAGQWGNKVDCQVAACNSHLFSAAQQCEDGSGCTPNPVTPTDCTPYACNAGGCLGACTTSEHCAPGHVCQGVTCSAAPINKPGSIRPGSEYYGPALAGWTQCAGWTNTSEWDILTTDWVHSCATDAGKQLRVRLHDPAGVVVFDESYPAYTQTELNNNTAGCDDNGYGTCGKYGPSGKALFIYKPSNGNGGCHGDDNSCGAIKIAPNNSGTTMGQNHLFLGGKRNQGATYRDHAHGSTTTSEIRWPGAGSQWNGCGGDARAVSYSVAIYRSL